MSSHFAPFRTPPPKSGQCVPFTLINLFPSRLIDASPCGCSLNQVQHRFGLNLCDLNKVKHFGQGQVYVALIATKPPNSKRSHMVAILFWWNVQSLTMDSVLLDTLRGGFERINDAQITRLKPRAALVIADKSGAPQAFSMQAFPHIFLQNQS